MRSYLKYMFISALIGWASMRSAFAQNTYGWRELEKVFKAYSHPISFKGDMKLYAANDTLHVLEDLRAAFTMNGMNTDYKLGYVEMIGTPKYTLTVNNHYKTIFIARAQNASGKTDLFDFNALRTSLKADSAEINVDKEHGKGVLSVALHNDPRIKRYEIFYSPVTYLISHLSILVVDENKPGDTAAMKVVKVRYSAYGKPMVKRNSYAEKIIMIEGKRLVPTEKYKSYQIISQL